MSGSIPNCVIKSSSIHRSFNRAVALHGVHDVLVESNVAYDVMGHAYFLEDAIETRNTFAYNLAVLTRPSNALLSTDQTVAAPELELIPRRLSARLATPRNRLRLKWVRPSRLAASGLLDHERGQPGALQGPSPVARPVLCPVLCPAVACTLAL